MDRRTFLKLAGISLTPIWGADFAAAGPWPLAPKDPATAVSAKESPGGKVPDTAIKDRLIKSRLFDHWFKDDIVLPESELQVLAASLERLKRVQRTVGYGNFSLLSFDEALSCGRSYASVGPFTKTETDFLEKIFYNPARDYGFMGEKPIAQITGQVNQGKVDKIQGTGHFLYKGGPVAMYEKIQKTIGQDVVLTSGIRGVVKQFLLFLDKADKNRGNLSLASRSLAPPGYSFHGVGDFDVGERGFGVDNFTEKFTETQVYSRLTDLGFVRFRYDRLNDLGVRFEPWHVEVGIA